MYGLVKDKTFPIRNSTDINNVVEFFHYCLPSKRSELAVNINRKAKELGARYNITQESTFYKFADKSLIQDKETMFVKATEGYDLLANVTEFVMSHPKYSIFYKNIKNRLMNTYKDLISMEEYFLLHLKDMMSLSVDEISAGKQSLNVICAFNKMMEDKYFEYYSKLQVVDDDPVGPDRIKYGKIFFRVVDDINMIMAIGIRNGNEDIIPYKNKLSIYKEMVEIFNLNKYVINRYLYALTITIVIARKQRNDTDHSRFSKIEELINQTVFPKGSEMDTWGSITIHPDFMANKINFFGLNSLSLATYLSELRTLMKSKIRNILMVNTHIDKPLHSNFSEFSLLDVVGNEYSQITDIVSMMDGMCKSKNIKYYNPNYTLKICTRTLMFIEEKLQHSFYERIYSIHCRCGNILYFGVCKGKLYIFGENTSTGTVIAVALFDKCYDEEYNKKAYYNFVTGTPRMKLKIFEITPTGSAYDSNYFEKATEGLIFDKEGNVKFKFMRKSKYMDKYDKAHKELAANWEVKNYEGVKQNLAFLFALIVSIERDVTKNKEANVSEAEREDAVKARMFAINDFKTYLRKLNTVEKSFNFTDYYEKNDYDKVVYTVEKDTIVGIKKLFQAIMMA
jgi:hypothetical protein